MNGVKYVVVKKYSNILVKRQKLSNYYNTITKEWVELKDATWYDTLSDAAEAIHDFPATEAGVYQIETIYMRL